MPETASEACGRCNASLAQGALVCPECKALIHTSRLDELAALAREQETRGELASAIASWRSMLELLPADSTQSVWIRAKLDELVKAAKASAPEKPAPAWTRKLGPFAPIALFLLKGKFFLSLLKLKFLLSFVTFAGLYWALYGIKFGIGFAVLILVHELGHYIEVRRRGLAADLPMFIPGFGAYVRWTAFDVTPETRALVSLAGPLAGTVGAIVCALLWLSTEQGVWIGLASFSALVNLMNLIPVLSLDGAQAMPAINRAGRIGIAIAATLFCAFFRQPFLLLVAAGAVYRAASKEVPPDMPPRYGVTAYFITLLAVLGYLATLAPLGVPAR